MRKILWQSPMQRIIDGRVQRLVRTHGTYKAKMRPYWRTVASGVTMLALAGCASGGFTNRLYCSADRQNAAFTSWYLGLGIGAQVDARDTAAVCAATAASGVK